MAIDSQTWPVKSADREMVALLAQFTGNGTGAPSSVRGRGVTVTRTALGTYKIVFPATLSLAAMRGVELALTQAAGTKYELQATITDGNLVVTAKSGGFVQEHQKLAADSAAGDATAETAIGYVHQAGRLLSVHYVPAAALTADDTNFATLIVRERDSAGANPAIIAQVTTEITGGSGDWTAWAGVELTLDATQVDAGASLTFEITKSGTGVAVPAGKLVVTAGPGTVDLASTETVLATAWVRNTGY